MAREDISNNLVHWTKGDTDDEAFEVLKKILLEEQLIGGTGFIAGKHQCVCFTETPYSFFHNKRIKYKPFGIEFSKREIFSRGGRPVIYQLESERHLIHEDIEWRHVTYNPVHDENWVDFTWEREWRLPAETLQVSVYSTVYVKNWHYADRLYHELKNEYRYRMSEVAALGNGHGIFPSQVEFKIKYLE